MFVIFPSQLNKTYQGNILPAVQRLLGNIQDNFVPDNRDYTVYTGSTGKFELSMCLNNSSWFFFGHLFYYHFNLIDIIHEVTLFF